MATDLERETEPLDGSSQPGTLGVDEDEPEDDGCFARLDPPGSWDEE